MFHLLLSKISSSEYGRDDEENERDDGLELVPESSHESTSTYLQDLL